MKNLYGTLTMVIKSEMAIESLIHEDVTHHR